MQDEAGARDGPGDGDCGADLKFGDAAATQRAGVGVGRRRLVEAEGDNRRGIAPPSGEVSLARQGIRPEEERLAGEVSADFMFNDQD